MRFELKYFYFSFLVVAVLLSGCVQTTKYHYIDKPPETDKYFPEDNWDVINKPETIGWSSDKLSIAKKKFKKIGATALMIVDDGIVVAEWGDTKRRVNSHSVRKSFLSALYGIFIENKKINPQETLSSLGIDDINALSDDEKQARIIDLLKSRSGIYHPAAYETARMKKTRPKRGSHLPGTHWYYNNWDFNVLGTIFEQETSAKIFNAFNDFIAIPIGMEDFKVSRCKYIRENVSRHPAYPFWMSARDRARFGLLFLRNGQWKNKQIIPPKWIEASTKAYSTAGRGIGYGYMWWVSMGNWHLGNKIEGKAYSARGYWGQYIIVLPEYNLVVVQVSDRNGYGRNASGKKFNELLSLILAAREK